MANGNSHDIAAKTVAWNKVPLVAVTSIAMPISRQIATTAHARMHFPPGDDRFEPYLALCMGEYLGREGRQVPPDMAVAMAKGAKISVLLDCDAAFKAGMRAALVFRYLLTMHEGGMPPALAKACYATHNRIAAERRQHGQPQDNASPKAIQDAWKRYRSVAHLWAACHDHYGQISHEMLALAGAYREKGQSLSFGRGGPLLPDDAVKIDLVKFPTRLSFKSGKGDLQLDIRFRHESQPVQIPPTNPAILSVLDDYTPRER